MPKKLASRRSPEASKPAKPAVHRARMFRSTEGNGVELELLVALREALPFALPKAWLVSQAVFAKQARARLAAAGRAELCTIVGRVMLDAADEMALLPEDLEGATCFLVATASLRWNEPKEALAGLEALSGFMTLLRHVQDRRTARLATFVWWSSYPG